MNEDEYYEEDFSYDDEELREEEWNALTDGQYGDYPGGDIDYDIFGNYIPVVQERIKRKAVGEIYGLIVLNESHISIVWNDYISFRIYGWRNHNI